MRKASTTWLTSKYSVIINKPKAETGVDFCWISPFYPAVIQCSYREATVRTAFSCSSYFLLKVFSKKCEISDYIPNLHSPSNCLTQLNWWQLTFMCFCYGTALWTVLLNFTVQVTAPQNQIEDNSILCVSVMSMYKCNFEPSWKKYTYSRSHKFDLTTWGKHLWVDSFIISKYCIENSRFNTHEIHIVYTSFQI